MKKALKLLYFKWCLIWKPRLMGFLMGGIEGYRRVRQKEAEVLEAIRSWLREEGDTELKLKVAKCLAGMADDVEFTPEEQKRLGIQLMQVIKRVGEKM
ncbi:MAG: hypothetical protein J7L42_00205 [Elusimicrobia bacterium]|nr:hypothetical protein [Elusimicrobiota bacterium]